MITNFYIGTNIELTKKPDWLADFRKKYDWPLPDHITLKFWTQVEEEKILVLKQELEKIVVKIIPIKVCFEKILIDNKTTFGDFCIMILADENKELVNLKKIIEEKTGVFGDTKPEFMERERIFIPHLTIARRLNKEKLEQAKSEIGEDVLCEGVASNLVLCISAEPNAGENPRSQEEYRFAFRG